MDASHLDAERRRGRSGPSRADGIYSAKGGSIRFPGNTGGSEMESSKDRGCGYGQASVPVVLGGTGDGRGDERSAQPDEVSQAFRQSGAMPGGDGGLQRNPALGAAIASLRTRDPHPSGEDGQSVRSRKQERRARCPGDLDGGPAARLAHRGGEDRGAARRAGAARMASSS